MRINAQQSIIAQGMEIKYLDYIMTNLGETLSEEMTRSISEGLQISRVLETLHLAFQTSKTEYYSWRI